jgi:hypothetical protein
MAAFGPKEGVKQPSQVTLALRVWQQHAPMLRNLCIRCSGCTDVTLSVVTMMLL